MRSQNKELKELGPELGSIKKSVHWANREKNIVYLLDLRTVDVKENKIS